MKSMKKIRIALRELLSQYTSHADRLAKVEEELKSTVGNPTKISLLLKERNLLTEYIKICLDEKEEIRRYCGDKAADIIWDSYAIRMNTETVAHRQNISKRSLELWMDFWLDQHYLIRKYVEEGETPWIKPNM